MVWYLVPHFFPFPWALTTKWHIHYSDVIMSTLASQITYMTIVWSTACSGIDQRKHQSSASLAFVKGIHQWLVDSPHKGPVTWEMCPFDVIMSKMNDKYMHQWTWPSLVQIMACLFDAKASIWTNHELFSIGPFGLNFIEIRIKVQWFLYQKMRLKCHLHNGHHLVSASNVLHSRLSVEIIYDLQLICHNPNWQGHWNDQRKMMTAYNMMFLQ